MAFAIHADALAPVVLNAAHQFAEGEQRNAVLPHGKVTSKPQGDPILQRRLLKKDEDGADA